MKFVQTTKCLLTATAFFSLCLNSCSKRVSDQGGDNGLINEAKAFFGSSISPDSTSIGLTNKAPFAGLWRDLDWGSARLNSGSGKDAVIVPLRFRETFYIGTSFGGFNLYNSNYLQDVLIYKDSAENFQMEIITFFPDSNIVKNPTIFSGIIRVEDKNQVLLKQFLMDKNGVVKKLTTPKLVESSLEMATTRANFGQICWFSSGYNYAKDIEPYYWEIELGCTNFGDEESNGYDFDYGGGYSPPGQGDGGGGGGYGQSSIPVFSVTRADNPIRNIKEYIKCFTNVAGSTNKYTVTVCVAQPESGSREPWSFNGGGSSASSSPVAVGHAFLIMSQTNSGGSFIRNIGFYPQSSAHPLSPSDIGQLNDDSNHDFNLSLTITVDNSQFFKILDFANHANDQGNMYNLNSNNCVNFVLNSLSTTGIYLPSTKGTWSGGGGNNPGDLGEDIRQMLLSPNMSRSFIFGTHPNYGFCY